MQNKNFKSCCAINVLLAQNSKFNNPTSPSFKNKIGLRPFFFLGGLRWKKNHPPKPTHAFNCNLLKLLLTFDQKSIDFETNEAMCA